jgi:hypothetical protein
MSPKTYRYLRRYKSFFERQETTGITCKFWSNSMLLARISFPNKDQDPGQPNGSGSTTLIATGTRVPNY